MLEGQLSQLSAEVERLFDEARGRARRELSDQLNQSVRRLRQAGSLDQLVATLLDAAATFTAGAAIFRIAGPAAKGERIRGVSKEARQGFGSIEIPLSSAPALAGAVETRDPVIAVTTAAEVSPQLVAFAAHPADGRAFIVPLVLKDRVPAVLYCWGPVQGAALEMLAQVAAAVWVSLAPPEAPRFVTIAAVAAAAGGGEPGVAEPASAARTSAASAPAAPVVATAAASPTAATSEIAGTQGTAPTAATEGTGPTAAATLTSADAGAASSPVAPAPPASITATKAASPTAATLTSADAGSASSPVAPAPPVAAPPQPISAWDAFPATEQALHLRAQRFARVRVAEMRLYEGAAVESGRSGRDLYGALRRRIDDARVYFRESYLAFCPNMADYLHVELVRTLAHDDPDLLGKDYPGPLV